MTLHVIPTKRALDEGEAHGSTPRERPDDQLLLDVRRGDLDAYAELYRRHHPAALRYARSLVRREMVDDVVAESFANMLSALQRDKGPRDYPDRYLMVVVRNTAIAFRNRQIRHQSLKEKSAPIDAVDDILPLMSDDEVVIAFRSLPERWQQVILWSEIDELTPSEIGARLGLSATAASALAYRARKGLRLAYLDLLTDSVA